MATADQKPSESIDLGGKTVVITGGARRIGRTIALRMAERGANIAFTYLHSEAEAEKLVAQIGLEGGEGNRGPGARNAERESAQDST